VYRKGLKGKTVEQILKVTMGGTRGYKVFWTRDGGVVWYMERRTETKTKAGVDAVVRRLQSTMPKAEYGEHESPSGRLPEHLLLKGPTFMRVGSFEPRGLKLIKARIKRRILASTVADTKADAKAVMEANQHTFTEGPVKAVEVRRGTNLVALSVRLGDDRPTVKTAPEWKRFWQSVDSVRKTTDRWAEVVEASKSDTVPDFEQRVQEEVAKRLAEKSIS